MTIISRFGILTALGVTLVTVVAAPQTSSASTGEVLPTVLSALLAAPSGSSQPGVISARKVSFAGTADEVITCTADKQVPHKSTHAPTTVNVVAVVSCTSPVTTISADVALYRNGAKVSDSGYQNANNVVSKQVTAASSCINALYGSWRGFTIVFPPGFVPPTGSWPTNVNDGYGPANQVTNC